jgi:hypothetical protein
LRASEQRTAAGRLNQDEPWRLGFLGGTMAVNGAAPNCDEVLKMLVKNALNTRKIAGFEV